ncbi:MAG: CoA transferase [Chloroflexi bacterium]|nr:CoA transferase [Chloroflexota bacterium]MDA1227940.1 CoA transferase [Chloroflexota bacterium]
MASALQDITVLDLTQGKAGAMASMLLRDNGARVIRLEQPDAENDRSAPAYAIWDRAKESVVLDVRQDRAAMLKLVGMADVLIEDFAPSSEYQRLVDYTELRGLNPRLVHCSITAYGMLGDLKDEPPHDDLVMAQMGIQSSQPGFREGPVHVAHPVPSVGCAILAAQGIVSSLLAREKTGRGRKVETSLMAGALMFAPKVLAEKLEPRPFQLTPAGGGPFYSVFECADERWVQLGCIHSGFVDLAAAVMGIADVMTDPRYGDGRRPVDEEARQELFDIVAGVIKTKPCHEWEEIFEAADVPYARACLTEESLTNPQVIANDMLVELDDPRLGHLTEMNVPIKFTFTPGEVAGARPVIGQHTEAVLSEIQSLPEPSPSISESVVEASPLHDVKVLEMTNVIAGPAAGKCLADLGADIFKLESHFGDISRPAAMSYFLHLNSNKRSLAINTKTPEGQEAAQRLAAQSDIMLANMRPGATDRMGLGSDIMKELNPGLVSAHSTAFGWTGPYSHRPGVDPLAQGWMGLQRAQGGQDNPPVFLAQLAPTDYTSGGLTALGAIMALYVRERTGISQKVDCNLINAGALLRGDDFMRYEGKQPSPIADKGQYGLNALHRLYETREGWIYVIAESQDEWKRLCAAIGQDGLFSDGRFQTDADRALNDAELALELSVAFVQKTSVQLLELLKSEKVLCSEVTERYNVEYFNEENFIRLGMVNEYQHPAYGLMKFATNAVRFSDTAPLEGRRTPLLGEHNREALAGVGYSDQEIDALYDAGVLLTESPG